MELYSHLAAVVHRYAAVEIREAKHSFQIRAEPCSSGDAKQSANENRRSITACPQIHNTAFRYTSDLNLSTSFLLKLKIVSVSLATETTPVAVRNKPSLK